MPFLSCVHAGCCEGGGGGHGHRHGGRTGAPSRRQRGVVPGAGRTAAASGLPVRHRGATCHAGAGAGAARLGLMASGVRSARRQPGRPRAAALLYAPIIVPQRGREPGWHWGRGGGHRRRRRRRPVLADAGVGRKRQPRGQGGRGQEEGADQDEAAARPWGRLADRSPGRSLPVGFEIETVL